MTARGRFKKWLCRHFGHREGLTNDGMVVMCRRCDRLLRANPTRGAVRIAHERNRQIETEGWTPEHDDSHDEGELARAAMAYLAAQEDYTLAEDLWPWEAEAFKPRTRLNALEVAGALIAAEIDRLERLSPAPGEEQNR